MAWRIALLTVLAGSVLTVGLTGCQPADGKTLSVFVPLEKVLYRPTPVRLGVAQTHLNPFVPAPWLPLQKRMSDALGREVQVLQLKPFQIQAKFTRGELDFALVSATQYFRIARKPNCTVLATTSNPDGSTANYGLIIVGADATVQSLADLKGKRFAFGPIHHSILHIAAANALMQAGVAPSDLTPELLPPFGFHVNAFEAAKSVLYEGVTAAVVDQQTFDGWPASGGDVLRGTLSRDRFGVLAKTDPVPNDVFLAGSKTQPGLVQRVQDFLVGTASGNAEILETMGIGGFVAVDETAYAAFRAVFDRVEPTVPGTPILPGIPGPPGRAPTATPAE